MMLLLQARSEPRQFDWRNLRLRIASAAILVPLALLSIWLSPWTYLVLLMVGAAALALEWARMAAPGSPMRSGAVLGLILMVILLLASLKLYWISLAVGIGGVALAALVTRGFELKAADVALGVAYLGVPATAMLWLHSGPDGLAWTLLLFGAVWAADIGAYAVGNIVKGPKLWPTFSPNKTWSGLIGGIFCAALAAFGIAQVFPGVIYEPWALPVGLLTGMATMGGDMAESFLKRRFGVKDSGDLIPGHGGLLDRVDGLLTAALVLALFRLAITSPAQ